MATISQDQRRFDPKLCIEHRCLGRESAAEISTIGPLPQAAERWTHWRFYNSEVGHSSHHVCRVVRHQWLIRRRGSSRTAPADRQLQWSCEWYLPSKALSKFKFLLKFNDVSTNVFFESKETYTERQVRNMKISSSALSTKKRWNFGTSQSRKPRDGFR